MRQAWKNRQTNRITTQTWGVRGLLLLTACLWLGCGGGGGGDDGDACVRYCAFACSKAANCGFFPASQIAACEAGCLPETSSQELCRNGQQSIQDFSCGQFAQLLGLARTGRMALEAPDPFDVGAWCGVLTQ